MIFKKIIGTSVLSLFTIGLNAQDVDLQIMPGRSDNFSQIVRDSMVQVTTQTVTTVKIKLSCFGRNVYSVPNPLGENSDITMSLPYKTINGQNKIVSFKFPAVSVLDSDTSSEPVVTNDSTVKGHRKGNTIRLYFTNTKKSKISSDGNVNIEETRSIVGYPSFYQLVHPTPTSSIKSKKGMAFTGDITSTTTKTMSANGGMFEYDISFPGEKGFCGSYWRDPLVLSFDDNIPEFIAKSKFPILENEDQFVYWPEAGNSLYFLALDLNNDNKITSAKELFANSRKYTNAYEALKEYDENLDGVIDANDPIFSKLLLWNDKNANGKSDKKELFNLKDLNVVSISLNYENRMRAFGERAEIRQKSTFKFIKSGKVIEKNTYDIWLNGVKD